MVVILSLPKYVSMGHEKTYTVIDTIAISNTCPIRAWQTLFYILIVWLLRLYPINVLVWLDYYSPFNQHDQITQEDDTSCPCTL